MAPETLKKREQVRRFPGVGERLRTARKYLGYSSTLDIAAAIGASHGSISRWELGESCSFIYLLFLYDEGISMDWIFYELGSMVRPERKCRHYEELIREISSLDAKDSRDFWEALK